MFVNWLPYNIHEQKHSYVRENTRLDARISQAESIHLLNPILDSKGHTLTIGGGVSKFNGKTERKNVQSEQQEIGMEG